MTSLGPTADGPSERCDPDAVAGRLRALGASVARWGNGAGDRYSAHAHDYDKVLVVTQGDITFRLTEGLGELAVRAGDRLDLPAGTEHAATVGRHGVQCLEGHLSAGRLGSRPRRLGGWALVGRDPDAGHSDETSGDTGT